MSPPAGIQVVSWDLDGTLYELPALKRGLRRLALRRGLRAPWRSWAELRALLGARRAFEAVRRAGGDLAGLQLPLAREELGRLEQDWYGEALRQVGPRAGVAEALESLSARGLRQVLVSDHPAGFKLEALGLTGCFEQVFVSEAAGALKPSPAVFQAVAAALGVAPAAILHLGDREETDGAAARAAGCQVQLLPARGPCVVQV